MRPQNSYLGFPKHCQTSSLFSSSKIVVLKNHTQLVFPNYEGGIYLKTFNIIAIYNDKITTVPRSKRKGDIDSDVLGILGGKV